MPLRYRRSLKILPGIKINFSKSGVSTTVGGRGAHVTIGHGKVRTTLSAPGTGLSYTTSTKTHGEAPGTAHGATYAQVPPAARPPSLAGAVMRLLVFAGMVAILARVIWLLYQ